MKSFHVEKNDSRAPLERMQAGDWYIADDPAIQHAYRHALAAPARF